MLCGITHKERGGKLSSRHEKFCFEMSRKGSQPLSYALHVQMDVSVERRSVAYARAIMTKSSHLNLIVVGKFSINLRENGAQHNCY